MKERNTNMKIPEPQNNTNRSFELNKRTLALYRLNLYTLKQGFRGKRSIMITISLIVFFMICLPIAFIWVFGRICVGIVLFNVFFNVFKTKYLNSLIGNNPKLALKDA